MIEHTFQGSIDEDDELGWTEEKQRSGAFERRSHEDGLEGKVILKFSSLPEES